MARRKHVVEYTDVNPAYAESRAMCRIVKLIVLVLVVYYVLF
ncbi:hypothetical protein [Salmonella phage SE4]|nr:membrane protein [Salmonella phage SE4]QEG07801.1 hypothetical protein [Salmonella phage SE4]